MSPYLPGGEWDGTDNSTPIHQWCRMCDPDGKRVWDPWEPRLCQQHYNIVVDAVEIIETPTTYYCAQGDAGGEANKNMCDLIHRRTNA